MTTSVVIPVYNGIKYLKDNLPLVNRLGVDEIVIVDDASTDGSAEFIARNYPQVKLIRHLKNLRFPISVNHGFEKAIGDVVFLLNQDLKPDKNLVKNTLKHFKNKDVFAVTFNENGRSWAEGIWKYGMLEFTNGKLDDQLHDSLWPSGGSSAIRHDLWNKLGGFDPIFTPGYFEDLDLGLRAQKAGYKIVWDPKCKVDHLTEGTFPKTFSAKKLQYIKERNYLIGVWKNIDSILWPTHIISLIKRIFVGPGYLIPLILALWKKTRYLRLNIVLVSYFLFFFMILVYFPPTGNIFNLHGLEIHKINQRRSFYKNELLGKLLENKVIVYVSHYLTNLSYGLDPNLYFFASHPRERAGYVEFHRIPSWLFPLFLYGLYKQISKNQYLPLIYFGICIFSISFFIPIDQYLFLVYPFIYLSSFIWIIK